MFRREKKEGRLSPVGPGPVSTSTVVIGTEESSRRPGTTVEMTGPVGSIHRRMSVQVWTETGEEEEEVGIGSDGLGTGWTEPEDGLSSTHT